MVALTAVLAAPNLNCNLVLQKFRLQLTLCDVAKKLCGSTDRVILYLRCQGNDVSYRDVLIILYCIRVVSGCGLAWQNDMTNCVCELMPKQQDR